MSFRDRAALACAKIDEPLFLELILLALFVMSTWAIVFNQYVNRQSFIPTHNILIIGPAESSSEVQHFTGEKGYSLIGDFFIANHFLIADKDSPVTRIIGARNRPEIFDFSYKIHSVRFCRRSGGDMEIPIIGFPRVLCRESIYSNVWSIRSIESFLGNNHQISSQAYLPRSQSRIDDYSQQRKPFDKQFIGFTSPVFLSFGYMLINKTLRWLRFDGSVDVKGAFALILLSAILIWIGQFCLFSVLGFVP